MWSRYTPGLLGSLLPLVLFCGFAISSQAQPVPNQTEARERTLLAESYTTERLGIWQKRLNLEGWNISVVVCRATDLKPRTAGNIRWDAGKKKAVIRALDPADYNLPMADVLADLDFTVVHELIHLQLSSLPRSEASRGEEEHAVNQIARALLALDRKR